MNLFTSKEVISNYFRDNLAEYLDGEFNEYCTEDDYYQPVCEDFFSAYYVTEWCNEHGFEKVSCEGSGEDGGYKPKYRRGWY